MFDLHPACADTQIVDATEGIVKCVPPRKRVALVGFGENTRDLTPWHSPELEIWGMNTGYLAHQRRADRWFEIHRPEHTPDMRDPGYEEWRRALTIPLYMQTVDPRVPMSVRYPIDRVLAAFKIDYFTSSIAFMLALAILEGFQEIHLYGIDLVVADEYFHQKACVEWWLGVAYGRGINVYTPPECAILKQQFRYGYEVAPSWGGVNLEFMGKTVEEYQERHRKLMAEVHTVHGALQEATKMYGLIEAASRGAVIARPFAAS